DGVGRHGWRPVAACAAVIAAGPIAVLAGPYLHAPPGTGLLDLIFKGDPQPPLSLPSRLARAVYGVLRTAAWIPPWPELTPLFAPGYGAAALVVLALLAWMALVAWRRGSGPPGRLWLGLLLLAAPFTAMGVYYYPSDPERWLILVPAAWLLVG